jgi:hypothetical protein
MQAAHLIFYFGIGACFGMLASRAIKPPRRWSKALDCMVGALTLFIVAAIFLRSVGRVCSTCGHPDSLCVANLKLLHGAKEAWALEFKKADTDVPQSADLFGDLGYIQSEPTCPAGGTYKWGAVREKPTCSLGGPGHQWPVPTPPHSTVAPIAWGLGAGAGAVFVPAMLLHIAGRRNARVSELVSS